MVEIVIEQNRMMGITGPATAHTFRPDVGKKVFAVSPVMSQNPLLTKERAG